MRPRILVLALVACFVAAPESVFPQQLSALRAGAHHVESAPSYRVDAVRFNFADASSETPRWPFVLGGAVVGGVAAGVWYAATTEKNDDNMFNFTVPVVGIGVAAGALAGLVVGEFFRIARATPPES